MKIQKRDGRIVEFDQNKVIDAILAAFKAVDGDVSDYAYEKAGNIADFIKDTAISQYKTLTVEDIQDLVEKGLMSTKRKDVAKAYMLYREERSKTRQKNSKLIRNIEEKLKATDIQNQNANLDEDSFGGRMGEARAEVMKDYALNYIISEKSRENHLGNMVYIHDLDSYAVGMHNCLSIPFDELLAKGFNTRQTDVRGAQSINTAFQLVAVIFQLQSLQQYGGVSATHIDWTMVPYVRKSFYKHFIEGLKYIEEIEDYANITKADAHKFSIDDANYKEYPKSYSYAMEKTKKELKQACEGMYHNLNTLQSRSGNQLPFTSINYGTCTSLEGQLVTEALINGSIAGVGKHKKTAIFPCGIFQVMSGVNKEPGTPNYDLFRLALKSTAQRLYPNYCNVDWSGNAGYDVNDPKTYMSTMGCRTVNGRDINEIEGVHPLTKDGRGNICPVTVIMPTLAMMAKESEGDTIENFISLLDTKINEAKDMLIERFDFACTQSPNAAKFMYENGLAIGYNEEEGIRSALKHGTIVIGQLGLAETLQILIETDHTTEAGMELAKRIEQLFKDRCAEFKQHYKLNFGVYYTPAENLCHTSMKKFKEKYGVIPNVSERTFFTNSMHVPVWYEIDPFEKIDIEAQLTGYSSAGCITYVELDSGVKNNIDGLETLVVYAMDKDIPYFAINVPNDTCLSCGYCDEFNDACPECGSDDIQQLRRVTGYLTGDFKSAFNKGKVEETELRFKHSTKIK